MPNRKRKTPKYKAFKLTKRIKPPVQKKLPSVARMLLETWQHMWQNKRLFFGLIAIYFLLNLLFVKGLTTALDVPAIKQELQQSSGINGFELGATLLGVVAGSGSGAVTEVANLYQTIIVIVCALAFIWLFRHTYEAKQPKKIKLKQPFYEGMAPLIPFLLLLIVIGVQLLPMVIGVSVFSTVQVNGLAVTVLETTLWALLTVLMTLFSFYLVSASLLSLIIVTLPDMTPMQAYRSAKRVVAFRRWVIMRKLLLSAILLAVIFGGILLFFIMTLPVLTEWVMALLSALALPLAIGSGYKLYRSLL